MAKKGDRKKLRRRGPRPAAWTQGPVGEIVGMVVKGPAWGAMCVGLSLYSLVTGKHFDL
jgi:hypothetical protein